MDVDMASTAESGGNDGGEGPPKPPGAHRPHYHHHHQDVRGLLATAQQLLNEGKPSLALQAVMAAVKVNGGEAAVFETLRRARELYQNKLQSSMATEELSSLFARCMIHEAGPSLSWRPELSSNLEENSSILAESGREGIVKDAFMDGSSFVCLQCGGLVSNLRRDEHLAHWCSGKR